MRRWTIQVFDEDEVGEAIHGLTHAQTITLMEIFEREGVAAKAIEYDETRTPTGVSETVNLNAN